MYLMKGMKGSNMKFQIFASFVLVLALLGSATADDSLYLHFECSPGQKCIELAYDNGGTESVLATPAQVLGRADIKSASVQMGTDGRKALNIELGKEAAEQFEKITGENINKKLMVVLDNKILIAPTVREPISVGKIMISGNRGLFWEKVPWLQDLIKDSYSVSGRSVMIYAIIALAISISAFVFILLPRMRRIRNSSPE
jgi:hypothetical protein